MVKIFLFFLVDVEREISIGVVFLVYVMFFGGKFSEVFLDLMVIWRVIVLLEEWGGVMYWIFLYVIVIILYIFFLMVMLVLFGVGLNLFFVIVMVRFLFWLFCVGVIFDMIVLFIIKFWVLLNWVNFFLDLWRVIVWFLKMILGRIYLISCDVIFVIL